MDKASKRMDNTPIPMATKSSGFPGQRLIVVHQSQLASALRFDLLRVFCPTDMGFFPFASGHERRRSLGSAQTIFIHCSQGTGWFEFEDSCGIVKSGDLLVIPAHCPHAYGTSTKKPWSIEWFHATGSGVSEFAQHLGVSQSAPLLSLRAGVWDSLLFEEALACMEAGFTDFHLIHTAQTLGHLLAKVIHRQRERLTGSSSIATKMKRAVVYLRENHIQSINVSDLATMFGFSNSHFTSLFHKHTGHPPMDYLIRVRIGLACQLLDLTDLSVKEVAARVGYPDPYYFSRVFKKVTAFSPKAYRRHPKG